MNKTKHRRRIRFQKIPRLCFLIFRNKNSYVCLTANRLYVSLHNQNNQVVLWFYFFQKLIRCKQRIQNLFILPLSVGETALEPVDVLLGSYISGRAFVTLDERLILPFFEIIFLDLVDFYASVVTAIIFPIDWQSLVLFHFQLIVFLGSEVAAGTQFT